MPRLKDCLDYGFKFNKEKIVEYPAEEAKYSLTQKDVANAEWWSRTPSDLETAKTNLSAPAHAGTFKKLQVVEGVMNTLLSLPLPEALKRGAYGRGCLYGVGICLAHYQFRKYKAALSVRSMFFDETVKTEVVEAFKDLIPTKPAIGERILAIAEVLLKRSIDSLIETKDEERLHLVQELTKLLLRSPGVYFSQHTRLVPRKKIEKDQTVRRGQKPTVKVTTVMVAVRPSAFKAKGALLPEEGKVLDIVNDVIALLPKTADARLKEKADVPIYLEQLSSVLSNAYALTDTINRETKARRRVIRSTILADRRAKKVDERVPFTELEWKETEISVLQKPNLTAGLATVLAAFVKRTPEGRVDAKATSTAIVDVIFTDVSKICRL